MRHCEGKVRFVVQVSCEAKFYIWNCVCACAGVTRGEILRVRSKVCSTTGEVELASYIQQLCVDRGYICWQLSVLGEVKY